MDIYSFYIPPQYISFSLTILEIFPCITYTLYIFVSLVFICTLILCNKSKRHQCFSTGRRAFWGPQTCDAQRHLTKLPALSVARVILPKYHLDLRGGCSANEKLIRPQQPPAETEVTLEMRN